MKTTLFEVKNLVVRPIFALAHDFNDAAKLLSDSLTRGMGMRPDADFDIVMRKLVKGSPEHLLKDWCKRVSEVSSGPSGRSGTGSSRNL